MQFFKNVQYSLNSITIIRIYQERLIPLLLTTPYYASILLQKKCQMKAQTFGETFKLQTLFHYIEKFELYSKAEKISCIESVR